MTDVRFDLLDSEKYLVNSLRLGAYRADKHSFLPKNAAYGAGLDGIARYSPSPVALLTYN